MTDEADPKLLERYRKVSAEEPPRALDEAILAAARRSARPWAQRFAVPLSLAAVVMLSVTLTLRVHEEQPEIVSPEPTQPASRAKDQVVQEPQAARVERRAAAEAKPDDNQPQKQRAKLQVETDPVAGKKESRENAPARNEPVPFQTGARDKIAAASEVASSAPATPAAPAEAGADSLSQKNKVEQKRDFNEQRERQTADRGAAAAPAAKPALQGALGESSLAKRSDQAALPPEKELERIAQLRDGGKHEEADKALAEFRKRHPDYRIDKAMLDRVERR